MAYCCTTQLSAGIIASVRLANLSFFIFIFSLNAHASDDYRWQLTGDGGELFDITFKGVTPEYDFEPDDSPDRYLVDDFSIQFTTPYSIPLGSNFPPLLPSVHRLVTNSSLYMMLPTDERPDLHIELERMQSPIPLIENFHTQGWDNFVFAITQSPSRRVSSGNIVSITKLQVPEPQTVYAFFVSMTLLLLSRRSSYGFDEREFNRVRWPR